MYESKLIKNCIPVCFHHFISQREEAEEDIERSRITEVGVAAQKRIRNSPSILVAVPGSKCDFCSASVHQQVEQSIKAGQVVAELQQVVAPSAGSMLHRRQKKKKK